MVLHTAYRCVLVMLCLQAGSAALAGPQAPGVYVEESPSQNHPVPAAATDITAFVGRTACGPANEPLMVRTFREFQTEFGGVDAGCPMTYAVRGFFENGGKQALIVRVYRANPDSIVRPSPRATRLQPRDPGLPLDSRTILGTRDSRTGLYALEKADLVNILCIPPDRHGGDTPPTVYRDALHYCFERRALLVVDPPAAWSAGRDASTAAAAAKSGLAGLGLIGPESHNAVLYFPRLVVSDSLAPGRTLTLAPSGHVAGVIARTDALRGVWKAPAGVEAVLQGILRPEVALTDGDSDLLIPTGINPLRMTPAGPVVWGARTLTSGQGAGAEFLYLPVRRTALHLQVSISQGLGWTVFEPNAEPLWARARASVESFLNGMWRAGAFQGSRSSDAYFVRCGRDTTTQAEMDRGVCVLCYGFAPLRPAEFVVMRSELMCGQGRREPPPLR